MTSHGNNKDWHFKKKKTYGGKFLQGVAQNFSFTVKSSSQQFTFDGPAI